MTDHDWQVCQDPQPMLAELRRRATASGRQSERKLRLFAVACYRAMPNFHEWYPNSQYGYIVQASEALADGQRLPLWLGSSIDSGDELDRMAIESATWCGVSDPFNAAHLVTETSELLKMSPGMQTDLLREIFGNPWKPVCPCPLCCGTGKVVEARYRGNDSNRLMADVVSKRDCDMCHGTGNFIPPGWLTWNDGTVKRMAERIYHDRCWEECPILSDALVEAGCDVAEIIDHLRGWQPCSACVPQYANVGTLIDSSGQVVAWRECDRCDNTGKVRLPCQHTRGCHILDILLGKS